MCTGVLPQKHIFPFTIASFPLAAALIHISLLASFDLLGFKSASKSMHILGEAFIPGFVKEA